MLSKRAISRCNCAVKRLSNSPRFGIGAVVSSESARVPKSECGIVTVPTRQFYGGAPGVGKGQRSVVVPEKKVTIRDIKNKYRGNTPIVMVTAYDILTSRCAHIAEVDMILVGDSVGMVVYGDPGAATLSTCTVEPRSITPITTTTQ